MKRLLILMLIGVFASVGFSQLDPVLTGDFEDGKTGDDNRYDNWWELGDGEVVFIDVLGTGATRGAHSLKITTDTGGWGWGGATATKDYGGATQEEIWASALAVVAENAVIAVDITAFDADVPGASAESLVGLHHSTSNGDSNWDNQISAPLITDGLSHTYYFEVHDAMREAFQASIDADGWGANFGIVFSTPSGVATVYIDNVWIYPEGPISEYAAYDPSVDQVFNADPMFVDATFYWNAGNDPNDDTYPIHPDIVDQYVFLSSGDLSDPNLYYVGNTGVDPGLVDPASQFGPITIPSNTKYEWVVAEAMAGYEQSLTVNVSTLEDLAEGNIRSSTWQFNALSLSPEIVTQPVSVRYPIGGSGPSISIGVSSASPEGYQWYYSTDSVIDEGDNAITSADAKTDTFTISSSNKAYQAYYYCKVYNAATISGGGTDPDIYSDVVGCVIERKVAEYLFEGDMTDSSGEGNDGTAMNGAAAVAGDSVEGSSALVLDGVNQYVDLGVNGYPNAGLDAVGGIGGGLDVGSVTCWVKLDTAPVTQAAILSNTNAGWPVTQIQISIESDDPATYTNLQSYEWGDQEGLVYWQSWRPTHDGTFNMAGDGQWHMLAVTWDMNGMIYSYVDGNLIASGSCTANTFSPWTNGVFIGAFEAGNYFDGKIDNLKVYNYALAPEDVGQEYFDITGNSACISGFDGDIFNVINSGSSYCRIDIMDFAAFASNWLSSGFFPVQ